MSFQESATFRHALHSNLAACLLFLTAFCGASGNLSAQDAAFPLAASVKPFVDRSELAGAVMLVANKDKILTVEAVGWADVEKQEAMQANSMFWIASQSKPITATAFMMLVEEGKIKLDDPVEKYLPEFASQMVVAERSAEQVILKKPQRPVTVRDILSHCSGLPFKSAIEDPTIDLLPLRASVRSYAMTPLDSEPGTRYRYSNAGINTAARIIEVVSQSSFEDFLQERLFDPLAMSDTTFWPSEEQLGRLAQSYKPGPEKRGLVQTTINQLRYPLHDRVKRFPVPAGGLFSTAHDLSRFYRMILNEGELDGHRYLSADSIKELTRKQTPDEIETGYGLGYSVRPGSVGHGGAYSTSTTIETESKLILVWLVQHAGFPGKGKDSQAAFRKAAFMKFGTAKQ